MMALKLLLEHSLNGQDLANHECHFMASDMDGEPIQ